MAEAEALRLEVGVRQTERVVAGRKYNWFEVRQFVFALSSYNVQSWNTHTHTHGHSHLYAVVLVRSRHNYVNVRIIIDTTKLPLE